MIPILSNWRFCVVSITPFILLPIAFLFGETVEESKKFKCAYVILLMGIFWVTEAMPLAVTALLPVVLFPVLRIQSTGDVAQNYMKETGMMFIGSISLALGIQYSGLHKRIALRTMILIGSSPWRLLLGILVTTMILSCCIVVNTAVAAMMVPIVAGLIESLEDSESESRKKHLKKLYMLAICYAANIGGTSIMIGSNPNLIFNELISNENIGQDGKYTDVNFASWIALNMPIALINLLITWLVLGTLYLGVKLPKQFWSKQKAPSQNKDETTTTEKINYILKRKLAELGNISFHEIGIIVLFSIAILLWLLRDPKIFSGWLSLFSDLKKLNIGDSSVAIGITILMFLVPKDIKYFKGDYSGKPETLMSWQYIHKHFPWSVVFLVGGGLAISDASNDSGLSSWIGEQLNGLEDLPKPIILLIILIFISCFTEIASNSATISLVTPILLALSKSLDMHPLYLSLPGAIACQYAFMLPTSNPPNAIVYTAGDMKIVDMVKAGVFLNFACIAVLFLMNISWGEYVVFHYSDYTYPNCTEKCS